MISGGFLSFTSIFNGSTSPTAAPTLHTANAMYYGLDFVFTGTIPPTQLAVTQVALEQWASIVPPNLQVTQAAIEQWASTARVVDRFGGQSAVLTATGLAMVTE